MRAGAYLHIDSILMYSVDTCEVFWGLKIKWSFWGKSGFCPKVLPKIEKVPWERGHARSVWSNPQRTADTEMTSIIMRFNFGSPSRWAHVLIKFSLRFTASGRFVVYSDTPPIAQNLDFRCDN